MPTFAVQLVDGRGRKSKRACDAASADALRKRLAKDGLYPLSIRERSGGNGTRTRRHRGATTAIARQLASLLDAGVPLAAALELTADAATGARERELLLRVLSRVEDGERLTAALSDPPELFPAVGIGMVAAGERSGSLAAAFERLADYLEHRQEQRRRLVAALSYPIFMLLAGLATCGVLVAVVLPRFSAMFEAAGVELPATTALLLGAGDAVAAHGLWVTLALAGLIGAFVLATKDEGFRRTVHEALLRAPVLGRLRRSHAAVHSGQALSSQLSEGVVLLAALESTVKASTDLAVRTRLCEAAEIVRSGRSLSAALTDANVFPSAFVRMVRIGERSGAVATLMHRAALLEERNLDRWMQRLIRYAEPAMIIGFGGLIGFIALALLQAVYGIHGGIAP